MPGCYLSVVIPAYNEAARLPGTLETVAAYLERQPFDWEIIVADDGSADATGTIVQEAANSTANVRSLTLPHLGKGSAVKNGMLAATGQYRFMCDADLSMPIECVELLLPPLAPQSNIIVGSREAAGANRIGEPRRRWLMGRVFNRLTRILATPGISDTQCGFKVFHATAAEALFPLQTLNGFAFDAEILFLARKMGFTMSEVGIEWHYRAESKVRPFRDSWLTLRDLLMVRWRWITGHYQT